MDRIALGDIEGIEPVHVPKNDTSFAAKVRKGSRPHPSHSYILEYIFEYIYIRRQSPQGVAPDPFRV